MANTQLIDAVVAGDRTDVARLLTAGADVNEQGAEQGWTALNYAAGKGDVSMIQLLLDRGANLAATGLDDRTPYMIALAAGRVAAAHLLRDVARERGLIIEAHAQERPYCQAYYLKDLRAYPGWREPGTPAVLGDDDIAFVHADLRVTALMWHDEQVVFDEVTEAWTAFCRDELGFRVPDDLDLIVPDEVMKKALGTT